MSYKEFNGKAQGIQIGVEMKKELTHSAGNPLTDKELKDYLLNEAKEAQELLVCIHKHVENVHRIIVELKFNKPQNALIDKGEDFDWDLRNDLEEIIYDIDEIDDSLLSFWAGIEAKFNKPK